MLRRRLRVWREGERNRVSEKEYAVSRDGVYRYGWIEDGLRHSVWFVVIFGLIQREDALAATPMAEWIGKPVTELDDARSGATWPHRFDSLKQMTRMDGDSLDNQLPNPVQ